MRLCCDFHPTIVAARRCCCQSNASALNPFLCLHLRFSLLPSPSDAALLKSHFKNRNVEVKAKLDDKVKSIRKRERRARDKAKKAAAANASVAGSSSDVSFSSSCAEHPRDWNCSCVLVLELGVPHARWRRRGGAGVTFPDSKPPRTCACDASECSRYLVLCGASLPLPLPLPSAALICIAKPFVVGRCTDKRTSLDWRSPRFRVARRVGYPHAAFFGALPRADAALRARRSLTVCVP